MTEHRWQFSIRGMLFFTALVAIGLSIVLKLPWLSQIVFTVAMTAVCLSAIMESVSVAPSSRRSRLSTGAWIVLGTCFLGYAVVVLPFTVDGLRDGMSPEEYGVFAVVVACGVLCFHRAGTAFINERRIGTTEQTAPEKESG
jgi:hypothetical protein